MIRWLQVLALAFTLLPARAAAEVVTIRSGEHPGFSRLVLDLSAAAPWQFGRGGAGYQLRLGRPGITFDLRRVYDRIPRSRLETLDAPPGGSALDLGVRCACHAELAELSPTRLVIDVLDGPPTANSLFERPIRPLIAATPEPPPPLARSPAPHLAEHRNPPMPVYDWRKDLPALPAQTHSNSAAVSAAVDATQPPDGLPVPTSHLSHEPVSVAAPDQPTPAAVAHPTAANADPQPPESHALVTTHLPEPAAEARQHLGGASQQLAQEIGRAATEGLLTPVQGLPRPAPPIPPTAPPASPASAPPVPPMPEGPRITLKTALDPALAPSAAPTTPEGGTCLPDSMFHLADWSGPGPPAAQIETLRRALVGEFDKPDPEAVGRLMRLYIALGFGAEARVLPHAMRVMPADADVLTALAEIMDHGQAANPGRLVGQTGCDGRAALWAVLAERRIPPGQTIATATVLRSFSALPLRLRRLLGPALAGRFLDAGRTDAADAVRAAVERAAGKTGQAVTLMNARIDLATGRPAEGHAAIRAVAESAGPQAPEAEVLLVEAALKARTSVAQEDLDRIDAQAQIHRRTRLGRELARAHLLALALDGDFDAAFRELAALKTATSDGKSGAEQLWGLLAEKGSDAALIAHAIDPAAAPEATRDAARQIAGRLLGLGFPAPALAWLGRWAPPEDRERLLAAQAHLALGAPEAAVAALGSMAGKAAEGLRAQALAMQGEHGAAAAAFGAAGDVAQSGAQAWRAGDWQAAQKDGTEAQKAALALALPAPEGPGQTGAAPAGELARGRTLVSGSEKLRSALETLLKAEAIPPPP